MWIRPKVTKKEKEDIQGNLNSILGSFIGTLLAFAWTTVVNELLDLIWDKYELPEVAFITSLIYASVVTMLWLTILISGKRVLRSLVSISVIVDEEKKDEEKKEKKDDDFE